LRNPDEGRHRDWCHATVGLSMLHGLAMWLVQKTSQPAAGQRQEGEKGGRQPRYPD
jgi:hypothetical protein